MPSRIGNRSASENPRCFGPCGSEPLFGRAQGPALTVTSQKSGVPSSAGSTARKPIPQRTFRLRDELGRLGLDGGSSGRVRIIDPATRRGS